MNSSRYWVGDIESTYILRSKFEAQTLATCLLWSQASAWRFGWSQPCLTSPYRQCRCEFFELLPQFLAKPQVLNSLFSNLLLDVPFLEQRLEPLQCVADRLRIRIKYRLIRSIEFNWLLSAESNIIQSYVCQASTISESKRCSVLCYISFCYLVVGIQSSLLIHSVLMSGIDSHVLHTACWSFL